MTTLSPRPRAGFTLIELLVVIAIIAMLAALMFPVFSRAKEKSRQATCLSNVRQIATAIVMYGDDWESYPGTDWMGSVQGLSKGVLNCPTYTEKTGGYAMNGYMHTIRRDLIYNPSNLIVCTDSPSTSAISTDLSRHIKSGISSRLDGSAVLTHVEGEAGRFACGKFPITPLVVTDDTPSMQAPSSFREVQNNDQLVTDFLFCGPYGKNSSTSGGLSLLSNDTCGESDLSRKLADVAPQAGANAPAPERFEAPIPGAPDLDVPFAGTGGDPASPVHQFKTWTKLPAYELSKSENYNCTYYGRATYYATYVFSEKAQTVAVDVWGDDLVKIWINGATRSDWTETQVTPVGAAATGTLSVPLPAGISYFLIKIVNATTLDTASPGGMKFKMAFKNITSKLCVSDTLD